jgi:hypothetical protein
VTRWPAVVGGAGLMVLALPMGIVLLLSPTSSSGACAPVDGPSSGAWSQAKIAQLWTSEGGNPARAQIASAVAMAESTGVAGATSANPAGGRNLGLWQIWDGNDGATVDPAGNARAAIRLSRNGEDWGLWETFATGAYLKYMQPVGAPVPCDAGVPGDVTIAAGANLPGRPIAAETLGFLARVAGLYGHAIVCTTGTNHNQFTVDGNVSDHFDGHACDLGMVANHGTNDGPVGDAIATACLTAAGDPPATAAREAHTGGLWTRDHDGLRIQCIWKTDAGGNHHDHVHVGARKTGGTA